MPNRAAYMVWEGDGFVVFVDGHAVGGTMPEWDAKAVVRWLNDGGDTLIPAPREPHEPRADDASPLLSRDELDLMRARVAGGTFDDLDMQVLIDHIDAVETAYEELVQRSAQEADRGQALVLEKEEALALSVDLHRQAAGAIERLMRQLALRNEEAIGAREIIRLALAAMREPLTHTDARRAREILEKYHRECAAAAVKARQADAPFPTAPGASL